MKEDYLNSIVEAIEKAWIKNPQNFGYNSDLWFDYPDYCDIDYRIAKKLMPDEVDCIQEYFSNIIYKRLNFDKNELYSLLNNLGN